MNYLVDTHIILWSLQGHSSLPEKARKILEDENNTLYYSIANVWEVGIKYSLHKQEFIFKPMDFHRLCLESGYNLMNITVEHIATLDTLKRTEGSPEHKDPFDRILLAQAKTEGFMFLSHDNLLDGYCEDCLVKV